MSWSSLFYIFVNKCCSFAGYRIVAWFFDGWGKKGKGKTGLSRRVKWLTDSFFFIYLFWMQFKKIDQINVSILKTCLDSGRAVRYWVCRKEWKRPVVKGTAEIIPLGDKKMKRRSRFRWQFVWPTRFFSYTTGIIPDKKYLITTRLLQLSYSRKVTN